MGLIPAENLTPWKIDVGERAPSSVLQTNLSRMQSFMLSASEAAKLLLIDALLLEVVPDYPALQVWKAAPLKSDTVFGVADYLVTPKRAYLKTPLLCAIEAKRDDFDAGAVQCVAEMAACRDNNTRDGHRLDVYGIVSNGQGWVFYKLSSSNEVFVSGLFTTEDMPKLLGVLHFVCAACAQNVP